MIGIGLWPIFTGTYDNLDTINFIEITTRENLKTYIFTLIIALTTTMLVNGAIIYCSLHDMRGGTTPIGQSFRIAMHSIGPLIGFGILYILAISLGIILLIIPGILVLLG